MLISLVQAICRIRFACSMTLSMQALPHFLRCSMYIFTSVFLFFFQDASTFLGQRQMPTTWEIISPRQRLVACLIDCLLDWLVCLLGWLVDCLLVWLIYLLGWRWVLGFRLWICWFKFWWFFWETTRITFAPRGFKVTTSELGGFVSGDTVVSARDLRVRGKVVVRQAPWRRLEKFESVQTDRLFAKVWWFQILVIFTLHWGDDTIWRAYFFQIGLKPPTSSGLVMSMWLFIHGIVCKIEMT